MLTEPTDKLLVPFTGEELYALAEFFGEDGTMSDDVYARVGRKFLIAAVKAGMYDQEGV